MKRLLLTAALALSWGSSFLWIKYALVGFSAPQITTVRLILGASVCLAFSLFAHARIPRNPRVLIRILGASVLANAAPYTLFAVGEQTTSSAIAGLLNSTAPIWTLIVGWALHDTGVTKRTALGVAIGFAGTVCMTVPGLSSYHSEALGILACLLASVCYGLSYLYIDRLVPTTDYSLPAIAGTQLACAAVVSLPFVWLMPHGDVKFRSSTVIPLVILGLLGTGIAYVINYTLIRNYGGVAASVVSYLIPVVAVLLGVIVLREQLSPWTLIGGAIAIAGVALTRSRSRVDMHRRSKTRTTNSI